MKAVDNPFAELPRRQRFIVKGFQYSPRQIRRGIPLNDGSIFLFDNILWRRHLRKPDAHNELTGHEPQRGFLAVQQAPQYPSELGSIPLRFSGVKISQQASRFLFPASRRLLNGASQKTLLKMRRTFTSTTGTGAPNAKHAMA